MSLAIIIKRYWHQFLAPQDSEKDPGFYDEILRWNKVGLRLVAVLAIIGPCLSIFISVVSGKSLTLSLADSPSSYSLITDLVTIALGAAGLTSSSSTPSCSTMMCFTFSSTEVIECSSVSASAKRTEITCTCRR